MIHVSHKIGRLAELRMAAPATLSDLATLHREMGTIGAKVSGKLVVCADLSAATLFPDEVADGLGRYFRRENPRLERVALVVGDSATFFLQVERMLREGGSASSPGSRAEPSSAKNGARGSDPMLAKRAPTRRAFRTPAEAMGWLDDVLVPDERKRLRSFFEPPPRAVV